MRRQRGWPPSAGADAGLAAGCGCTAHRAARPARGLLDLILFLLVERGLDNRAPDLERPPGISIPATGPDCLRPCLVLADGRRGVRLVAGTGGGRCLVGRGRLDPLEVDLVGGEQHADNQEADP